MDLKTLKSKPVNLQRRKRVGRGKGSGLGKTCGKGHKGQRCRSGYNWHAYFEGGQMPLYRRLPKKGFGNGRFRKDFAIINVQDLNQFADNETVDPEALQKRGLVKNLHQGLKVLGKGEIKVPLTVSAHHFSESAVAKIEGAGGKIEIIKKKKTARKAETTS